MAVIPSTPYTTFASSVEADTLTLIVTLVLYLVLALFSVLFSALEIILKIILMLASAIIATLLLLKLLKERVVPSLRIREEQAYPGSAPDFSDRSLHLINL